MDLTFDNYSIAPIQQKDAWRVCNFVVANEEYIRNDFPETVKANLTPTLSELFVAKKEKHFLNQEEFLFTLKENTHRSIIGLVFIKALNKQKKQAELAYCISYQYTGKGLMTKTSLEIINWAFNQNEIDKLQLMVHESNNASIRIAEKCGFDFITVLKKEHKRYNGEVVDMRLYELLRENFKSLQ